LWEISSFLSRTIEKCDDVGERRKARRRRLLKVNCLMIKMKDKTKPKTRRVPGRAWLPLNKTFSLRAVEMDVLQLVVGWTVVWR
jgi:hypothetical protein